jgi:hypothetical protein
MNLAAEGVVDGRVDLLFGVVAIIVVVVCVVADDVSQHVDIAARLYRLMAPPADNFTSTLLGVGAEPAVQLRFDACGREAASLG